MLAIGAVAGWLAGVLVNGYNFGLIGSIIVGVRGAVIAGFLAPALCLYTESTFASPLSAMTPHADQQRAGLLMIAACLLVSLVAALALSIPWLVSTKREP